MRHIASVAIGLLVALIATQEPQFLAQYRQQLSGRIEELQRQADAFDARARTQSLTRNEALARFAASPDPVVVGQGRQIEADFARLDRLTRDRAQLDGADELDRHWVFLTQLDRQTAKATWTNFSPGIPTGGRMILITVAGFVVGLLLGQVMLGMIVGLGRTVSVRGPVFRVKAARRLKPR